MGKNTKYKQTRLEQSPQIFLKITLHVCNNEKNVLKSFEYFFGLFLNKKKCLLLYNEKLGDSWGGGSSGPRLNPVIARDAIFFKVSLSLFFIFQI